MTAIWLWLQSQSSRQVGAEIVSSSKCTADCTKSHIKIFKMLRDYKP